MLFLDLNLFESAKLVIINEDDQKPFLINSLESNKQSDSNNCFNYAKFKHNKKIINIFECTEVYDFFLITKF
jgi:hypothetical protein